MSPKEVKITSGRRAIATARSISSSGVTQTGQPGPWTRVTSSGSSRSIPDLITVWVWPPQISIRIQGRVTRRRIAATSSSGRLLVPILVDVLHGPSPRPGATGWATSSSSSSPISSR